MTSAAAHPRVRRGDDDRSGWAICRSVVLALVVLAGAADVPVHISLGHTHLSLLLLLVADLSLGISVLLLARRRWTRNDWLLLGVLTWVLAVSCLGVAHGMSRRGHETAAVFLAGAMTLVVAACNARTRGFAGQLLVALRIFVVVFDLAYIAHLVSSHTGGPVVVSPRPWALLGPLAVAICVSAAPARPRLAWAAAAVQVALVAISGSRTAFAATVVSALITATALSRVRARWIVAGIAGAACVGGAAALWLPPLHHRLFLPPGVGDRGVVVFGHALNTSGRTAFWSQTWDDFLQHPWFGGGLGRAGDHLHQLTGSIEHPLNDYLRILDDTGIVGFAVAAVLFLALIMRIWRSARHMTTPAATSLARTAAAALPALALVAVTDNPIVYYWVVIPAAAVIGFTGWADSTRQDSSTGWSS